MGFSRKDDHSRVSGLGMFAHGEHVEPAVEASNAVKGLDKTVAHMVSLKGQTGDRDGTLAFLKEASEKLDTVQKVITQGANALPEEAKQIQDMKQAFQEAKQILQEVNQTEEHEESTRLGMS